MELPVLLTPSIRMRLYSITKHFTCLAYMLLCEDGKANIDDRLGEYFPEFRPATRAVTIRQLMTNTSGIRDAHGLCFQFSGTDWVAPSTKVLELYRTMDDVDAEPGSTWIYNSGGFVLLSHLIEQISGQSLATFMHERIFEPAGLHDTLLRRTDMDFVRNSATMHTKSADGQFVRSYVGGDRSGTGGIVSTVDDMLRWLCHMDAPIVGTRETWALMRTPQKLTNGFSTCYGFGLAIDTYRGIPTLYHSGNGMGANAHILKVPSVGLDVVVMANRDDISSREVTLRIVDACLPELAPIKPVDGPGLDGVYRSHRTGRVVRLYVKDGVQFAGGGGFIDRPFIPDDGGVLWPSPIASLPFKYAIRPIGQERPPKIIHLSDYGNVDELARINPDSDLDIAMIAGRYRSEATRVDAIIDEQGMRTSGHLGTVQYSLTGVAAGAWHAKASNHPAVFMNGTLSFNDSGFDFWSYCTRALHFRRIV